MSINLLYPQGKNQSNDVPGQFVDDLGLDILISPNCASYFSSDPEVIKYRLGLFSDILANPQLLNMFGELQERMREYSEFSHKTRLSDFEGGFYSLVDIRFYTGIIDALYPVLCASEGSYKSDSLDCFSKAIKAEAESEDYKTLCENLKTLDYDIHNIKSITIGVNLDSAMRPKEAGLLSINGETFKSGDLIDRLLRGEFKKNDYTCIAALTTLNSKLSINTLEGINESVINALSTVLNDTLNKCTAMSKGYLTEKMELFGDSFRSDVDFILHASRFLNEIRNAGLPLCVPGISEETHISGLSAPFLMGSVDSENIVTNPLDFDSDANIYILTGPNSGGKTVFVRSVGIAQTMFQLGMPISAKSAKMKVCDAIYTQFPSSATSGKTTGRLEEECRLLAELFGIIGPCSLVLMDEVFSSTSAKDGAELAISAIDRLCEAGAKCIFSTHIHELAEYYRTRGDGHGVELLAAEVNNGVRTYKMIRGRAEGTSDARTIAEKYGIL